MFKTCRIGSFKVIARDDAVAAWAATLLNDLASLPTVEYRQMGFLDLPGTIPESQAFVKLYENSSKRPRFRLWGRWPNDAIPEGKAYRRFASRGILVPRLLFYGVGREGGASRGIVAVEKVEGETLQENFERTGDPGRLLQLARLLGTIHRQRLAHGDVNFYNFILSGERIVTIDLARAKRLNRKRQHKDLTSLFAKVLLLGLEAPVRETMREMYERGFGRAAGIDWESLRLAAENRAARFEGTRWVKPGQA